MLQDVIVVSTDDGRGFYVSGTDDDLEVRGTVSGFCRVLLGIARTDASQHLHVTGTGMLIRTSSGACLYDSSQVENEGQIRGFANGLVLGPGSPSSLVWSASASVGTAACCGCRSRW